MILYEWALRKSPFSVPVMVYRSATLLKKLQAPTAQWSILTLDRLRLHGLSGATDEFTLAAVVRNLRRLAKPTLPAAPEYGRGAPSVAKMA